MGTSDSRPLFRDRFVGPGKWFRGSGRLQEPAQAVCHFSRKFPWDPVFQDEKPPVEAVFPV